MEASNHSSTPTRYSFSLRNMKVSLAGLSEVGWDANLSTIFPNIQGSIRENTWLMVASSNASTTSHL